MYLLRWTYFTPFFILYSFRIKFYFYLKECIRQLMDRTWIGYGCTGVLSWNLPHRNLITLGTASEFYVGYTSLPGILLAVRKCSQIAQYEAQHILYLKFSQHYLSFLSSIVCVWQYSVLLCQYHVLDVFDWCIAVLSMHFVIIGRDLIVQQERVNFHLISNYCETRIKEMLFCILSWFQIKFCIYIEDCDLFKKQLMIAI